MFPLGSAVVPLQQVPLHVFEARYRALVRDCLDGDGTFGIVLIERGSEVGGGDTRFDVGCRVEIVHAEQTPDGRWGLLVQGRRRLRVVEWLDDDPYPRAMVERWDDDASNEDSRDLLAGATARLRRALALKAELGEPAVDATVELSDDPALGSLQAAAVAPFGPADHQRLLAASGPEERLHLLQRLLDEEIEYLTARMGSE